MNQGLRKPAFRAPTPPAATAISENPAARLEQMYLHIWSTSMHDLPFVNSALSVEAVGFRRWQSANSSAHGTPPRLPAMPADAAGDAAGDWVGAVIRRTGLLNSPDARVLPGNAELQFGMSLPFWERQLLSWLVSQKTGFAQRAQRAPR